MVVTQAWPAKLRPSRPPSARPADGARLADATDRLRRRPVQIRRAEGNRGSQKEPQVKATIATRVCPAFDPGTASRMLRQDVVDDVAVDIGQPEVAAAVAISQTLVVESDQVQNRGVQVMDVDLVLGDVKAELVGGTISCSRLHPSSGQPHRKGVRMMIPASSLSGWCAAKLATPNDECFIE